MTFEQLPDNESEIKHDYAVYLLMRTDLPSMNSGKAMAQANHSGVHMAEKLDGTSKLYREYIVSGRREGASGFNTTIVLGATKEQIENILKIASGNVEFDKIIDPTYPFVVDREISHLLDPRIAKFSEHLDDRRSLYTREELTCAWFLGDREDPNFKGLFEGLSLHD